MDFEGWASSLGRQFAAMAEAPVPFAVAVLLTAFLLWKVLHWRYDATIERQREHIVHLERRPAAAVQPGPPSAP